MRRVAVVASASGNGKTTLGRELAEILGVPFVELDSLVHGPGWTETPDDVLRAQLEPIIASDGWVIDGSYQHKIGDLVPRSADTVVWLDLPIRVWFPRLVRRSWRRWRGPRAVVERQQGVAVVDGLRARLAIRLVVSLSLPPAPRVAGGTARLPRDPAGRAGGSGAVPRPGSDHLRTGRHRRLRRISSPTGRAVISGPCGPSRSRARQRSTSPWSSARGSSDSP